MYKAPTEVAMCHYCNICNVS